MYFPSRLFEARTDIKRKNRDENASTCNSLGERNDEESDTHDPCPSREHMAKMSSPTETERCIESLIAVFQKFAGKEGNNCTLSKTEFLTFMNTELAAFTKNQDPGVLDRMMKKLDLNADGQLDFQEFLNLIATQAFRVFHCCAEVHVVPPFLRQVLAVCSVQISTPHIKVLNTQINGLQLTQADLNSHVTNERTKTLGPLARLPQNKGRAGGHPLLQILLRKTAGPRQFASRNCCKSILQLWLGAGVLVSSKAGSLLTQDHV
ncbi:hypothetical protein GH733_016745 [Mirounga leonina]|nr:hypothetical protein GH733_016745 [Mirounga leonina]